jgi:hypothetical protein
MQMTQAYGRPANIINHFVLLVDESLSMRHLRDTTIRVFDGFIARLAARSRENGQETRVTVYFFNSHGTERCVIYDMDVLRVPSLAGMYDPQGNTALLRTFLLAVKDLRLIPQQYGDHSFAVFGFTDGDENDSHRPRHSYAAAAAIVSEVRQIIAAAPENETYGLFVPDQLGVAKAKQFGFPAANVSVWDATSDRGMEDAVEFLGDVADAFMEGRTRGVRGYSASSGGGLFKMKDFSAAEVQAALAPMAPGEYVVLNVTREQPIKAMVEAAAGAYQRGGAYYEFMKTENIQSDKEFVVEMGGRFYSGPAARSVLGLPSERVRVKPDHKAGCTIFVQSKSVNRKLIPGTRLLLLR